ncbi:malto-oligosyltrehalose trehalohydrolase [Nakamurella aerolata]|uniref:Malto-oligosyltrehalose trehalohydrolase n=1 Tax=Nakamurella aerolata TaxID=1656892 RepID=A0A849ABW1_9ACTN|nr:malto-oligosyltrehalose trehalohydrolase [Nakamurella aerolata]NNG34382.1 malto-oligosyltrehalose trehalohydrolase [Nakamurella aerolata]
MRVWAPISDRVRLLVRPDTPAGAEEPPADQVLEMAAEPAAAGWWQVQIDQAPDTFSYGFLLGEDDTPRPDPRSRRQPGGVHDLSRTLPADEFEWTDHSWTGRQLAGGVIYEMHIGTFTPDGTFDAAIERLDHLVELGVEFVEVLPVNAFNGTHNWGYDGVLWYAVQESYGGPDGYRRFVDACHARGIAVIQDVVYNHLGPSGNYLPLFGPYLHSGHSNTWGASVNLDGPDSDEVRQYILDNISMWLGEYHVDGLRLDAVHALADHRAVHILEDMAVHTGALSAHVGRPLTLIAESDLNDPRLITPRAAGGYGLTAQWDDDYHHVLHVALTGETVGYYGDFGSMGAIAKVLTTGFFHDGTWSSFRGRSHGRPINTDVIPTWALVGYAQDHDQIGNRATGDRLTASLGAEDLALAAVLVLTAPFTPMLFMGEEWAGSTPWQFFTSHPEPELGKATADGRIAEFARMGWDPAQVPDPQNERTFADSKLDWSERDTGRHAEIFDLHRRLIALRRQWPQLTDPRFHRIDVDYDDDARWLLINRGGLQIAANFSDDELTVAVAAHGGELLRTETGVAVSDTDVTLPGHAAVLLAPAGES